MSCPQNVQQGSIERIFVHSEEGEKNVAGVAVCRFIGPWTCHMGDATIVVVILFPCLVWWSRLILEGAHFLNLSP
jgi:hypothetical protein